MSGQFVHARDSQKTIDICLTELFRQVLYIVFVDILFSNVLLHLVLGLNKLFVYRL